ncbi:MAG: phenylacetate--CoA ligase family protein, partial [Desulfobacterales bacterium]|nr:phenylacetate--CoA ligase family protein [Desulfobacterales bacterium]
MGFIPYDMTGDKLAAIQLDGLKWTVKHVYKNSPFYRQRFEHNGVVPEDIRHLDDICRLPFTDTLDLQDGYPFPLRSV